MSLMQEPNAWDGVEKAMFVVLGWLLALLTTPIVEAIRRAREIRKTREGVLAELNEFKYRMAIVAYTVAGKYGTRSHDFLNWAHPIISDYVGPMPAERVAQAIELQLSFPPEKLQAYLETQREEDMGLSLKKYPLPFFRSKLDSVAWYPDSVRRLLFEINTQIGILDAELENAQYYFRMTFDQSLTGENRERVQSNLDQAYQAYGRFARNIADRITQVESEWK